MLIAYSLRLIAKMKRIVILGGGTGVSTLLKGLKKYPVKLSVIVSSWDDGGSNGRLRRELKAFPFSDIRQCLAALAEEGYWKNFFKYRFAKGELKGHTAANLFLANLQKITGSVEEPIEIAKKLLGVQAEIFPATLSSAVLVAKLQDGRKIIGEHLVDSPRKGKFSPIKSIQLMSAKFNRKAVLAIKNADLLVFGPGDLYTSVLPNLVAPGIGQAVLKSKATKVFIGNLMTKDGQTNGFQASDFIFSVLEYVPNLNYAIFNKQIPPQNLVRKYRDSKSEMVQLDKDRLKAAGVNIILENLLLKQEAKKVKGDVLKRSFLRHDSKKLAELVYELSNQKIS